MNKFDISDKKCYYCAYFSAADAHMPTHQSVKLRDTAADNCLASWTTSFETVDCGNVKNVGLCFR